jgi:methionyl-tRNA synthetase
MHGMISLLVLAHLPPVSYSCMPRLRDGLKHILNISRLGNAYIQANKPWTLVKQGPENWYNHNYDFIVFLLSIHASYNYSARAGSLLGVCANVVCLLSVMMQPYMPETSRQVQDQLQVRVKIGCICSYYINIDSLYCDYNIPMQAPEECNIFVETFVPFLQPGHRIGKVGIHPDYGCS